MAEMKTARQHNAEICGEFIAPTNTTPLHYPGFWRWLHYDEHTSRMEMRGNFTADDLDKIAAWMRSPDKAGKPYPVINVKLSKT